MKYFFSFYVLLLLVSFLANQCGLESDSPRKVHVEGRVIYKSDGLPAAKVTVQLWRWENDWDGDFESAVTNSYVYSIATESTNKAGEYKIVYSLREDEYCQGNGFCNIRAMKAGFIHDDWPAVAVNCIEEIQIINFQLY